MVEVIVADEERLCEIVKAFREAVWPVAISEGKRLADTFRWRISMDLSNSAHYFSGLFDTVESSPDAVLAYKDGQVAEARIDLCNFSKEHARKDMLAVRRQMTDCVESVLGAPTGKQRGDAYWELDNQGRIWVKALRSTVLLKVLHPHYADIERAEEHFGIPDDRIPGTGDESDYL